MSPKLIWCKLRQSINNFNQSFNIITRIIKTKYQSHTNTRIYVKKPLLLKGKKPQEILQIRFTMVKSIIKFQIYQPYVCLTAKEKFRFFFFFFSLSHTIFLLDWAYHKTLFFLHYYAHCKFSFFFASLCNINQSLTNSHWFVRFTKFLSIPKFCCLSPCIVSQAKISFQGIALSSIAGQPKNNQFNFSFFNWKSN